MMSSTKNPNPKLSKFFNIQTTRLAASLKGWTAL